MAAVSVRKRLLVVLIAASAMAIVAGGSALAVIRVSGQSWADYPAWLEAFSTFAAFSAATLAVWFAAGAFRLESEREGHWASEQRRGQAGLIAAWAGEAFYSRGVLDEATGFEDRNGISGARVLVRNASNLPVTGVQITAFVQHPETPEESSQLQFLCHESIPYVPPGTQPSSVRLSAPSTVPWSKDMGDAVVLVAFQFTDASNVRWRRGPLGELVEVPPGL